MGKAKWWICDGCRSLNDLPANKCYKCRNPKGHNPTLMDDQYDQISSGGGQQRVGVTVDLSQVGDLTRPDPIETQDGGGIMEAFGQDDDQPLSLSQSPPGVPGSAPQPAPVRPIREPVPRGIEAIGGRQWAEALPPLPPALDASSSSDAPPLTSPATPSQAAPPQPGTPLAPGPTPPPGYLATPSAPAGPMPPWPARDPESDE